VQLLLSDTNRCTIWRSDSRAKRVAHDCAGDQCTDRRTHRRTYCTSDACTIKVANSGAVCKTDQRTNSRAFCRANKSSHDCSNSVASDCANRDSYARTVGSANSLSF